MLKSLGLLPILVATSVFAQDPAATQPTAKPLSGAEMATEAQRIKDQTDATFRHLLYLKEQAKKQKDSIRLSCVNDKLINLKAQMNLTDSTQDELGAALTSNSDDRFSIMLRLQSEFAGVTDIREQANACAGEAELYKQESGITVDRPDVIDDPTPVDPFYDDVEPPGYASPFT